MTEQKAYPTDAKAREKERRKAQKASGKAHVGNKQDMTVEEHFDDCGEDLSSLPGDETCTLAWTTPLHEDSLPLIPEEAYSTECDRLWAFMLFGPHCTADMRHHKVIQLPRMSDLDQLNRRQCVQTRRPPPRRRRRQRRRTRRCEKKRPLNRS